MAQDPNRQEPVSWLGERIAENELTQYIQSQKLPSITDEYVKGTPLQRILPRAPAGLSLSDDDRQKEDARIYQAKLDDLSSNALWRHAEQETHIFHPEMRQLWDSNWEGEPGYVLPWDDFRKLTAGVPQIAWDDIKGAKSYAQAEAIRESSIRRLQEQQMFYDKYGGAKMFLTYMGAGFYDPVNLGLLISMGGVYNQAANVYKYSRLARFARVGSLAAAEGAAIVGTRAYTDPLQDEWNVMFASVLSGVFGGAVGGRIWKGQVMAELGPVVFKREAYEQMPKVSRGMWEDMWNHDRPPLYFEPERLPGADQTWANTRKGRLIFAGDRAGKSQGILFESQDGYSAFRVDTDGVITYWSPDSRVNGAWDWKTGRAHLNMETLSLKKSGSPKSLDIDGPGHPLKIEQLIEETLEEMRKKWSPDYETWKAGVRKAQEPAPGKPQPKVKTYPDDFDPDEAAAAGGIKGYEYDSDGFGRIPAHGIETVDSLLHRAALSDLGEDAGEEALEEYASLLRYPLMRFWNNAMGGKLFLEHTTEFDLVNVVDKHGEFDPESGAFVLNRDLAEMEPVAAAKVVRDLRRLVEQNQRPILKKVRAFEEAENMAYKQELIDLGEGTNKMFFGRLVVGPDTSVDSPIGVVTKVNEDGTVDVNFGSWKVSETDPEVPLKPVEEADVVRDPDSIMHPERLQTLTVDEITPISFKVLSRHFLENDVKLTPSKMAPLTDAQSLRLFESQLGEFTTPARIRLQKAKTLALDALKDWNKKLAIHTKNLAAAEAVPRGERDLKVIRSEYTHVQRIKAKIKMIKKFKTKPIEEELKTIGMYGGKPWFKVSAKKQITNKIKEIVTEHGLSGAPETEYRPKMAPAQGQLSSLLKILRESGTGEIIMHPVTVPEQPAIQHLGFGTLHYIELVREAQTYSSGFRNDPAYTTPVVLRIYKRMADAGIPFKEFTDAEGNVSPFYISAKDLSGIDLDKIAKNVTELNKTDAGYTPKQQAMEYSGVGPGGEPFTVDVYPGTSAYKKSLGITAKDIYASGEGPISKVALEEAARRGWIWTGPKEYVLHIRGGPKLGYDLKSTNLKELKQEIKDLLIDRAVRKESAALKHFWETQAQREALAEASRIEGEVLEIALGIKRLELEEVSDLLNHIPEHLRLRRFHEVQERISRLVSDWWEFDTHPASKIDPDDIEIITPRGKVVTLDDIRSTPRRPKKVVQEELETIKTYESKISKARETIEKTKSRISELKKAKKSKKLSKEDLATLTTEIKRLQKRSRKFNAKLRTLEKDLSVVEDIEQKANPFSRPKRTDPGGRRETRVYNQESDDFFFVRNKKTGKVRSIDDILSEAEDANASVRAKEATIKNAETPGAPDMDAFADTPHGIDDLVLRDLESFQDVGVGAKIIKGVHLSMKTKATNMPHSDAFRWVAFRILGGFREELRGSAIRGPFSKTGKSLMTVETESPHFRGGIETGRDEMVNERLAWFDDVLEDLQTWRRLNEKGAITYWSNQAQDEFGTLVGLVKRDKTGKELSDVPEHSKEVVMSAVKKAIKHFDGELDYLKKYSVKEIDPKTGELVGPYDTVTSDPHYVPRIWAEPLVKMHTAKDGLNIDPDELAKVFANGLLTANEEAVSAAKALGEKGPRVLSPAEAYRMGLKFIKSIGNNNFRLNLINDAAHQKATAIDLAKILEKNFGLDPQEAMDLAASFRVTEKKAKHTMYRIKMNTEVSTPVTTRKGTELQKELKSLRKSSSPNRERITQLELDIKEETLDVRLNDMIDHNIFTASRRYARHTSSKMGVEWLIHDWNAKIGQIGKYKSLDDIIETISFDIDKAGLGLREERRWLKYLDTMSRIARDQPFSESTDLAMGLQLGRSITYSMGQGILFGISANAEVQAASWVNGVTGMMEGLPALRKMVDGVVEMDKAQVKAFNASLGLGVRERNIARLDLMGRIVEEGGSTSLGRQAVVRRLWMGASRGTTEVSGLMKMTEIADDITTKNFMVHYGNMMIRNEVPSDTRLVDLRLTRPEWDRIGRQLRKHYKRQTSETGADTYQYDFSEWEDQGAVDLFGQAIRAEVRGVSQRSSRADMPPWYFANPTAHEFMKVALQYRGFSISSVNNYVVRALRNSDARAMWTFWGTLVGGAISYTIKSMFAHEDTPAGRKRFKERMTPLSIARGAFLNSGMTAGLENLGLFSGPLLGVDLYGNYHRMGLSNSWTDQIRLLSYVDDATALMQSLIQTQVLDSRDFTQADYRRFQRVFGFLRHPFLAPFVKDLGNGLPTQNR